MTSQALKTWLSSQRAALDRLDELRTELAGQSSESRRIVQQIDDAYILLLAAHFQRFFRSLHNEAAGVMAKQVSGHEPAKLVGEWLIASRGLDRGNAHPTVLDQDFKRFGMKLWSQLIEYSPANGRRRARHETLNKWRNSIAHQSFDRSLSVAHRERRTIQTIRDWRHDCDVIATQMDVVVRRQLSSLIGSAPW
jgi:hypothetical protein